MGPSIITQTIENMEESMSSTRCAVIGVGYLGKFHAQKYAALPNAELIAVVDSSPQQAAAVAADCNCRAVTDYRELLGRWRRSASRCPPPCTTPGASDFLEHGTHVLVEKAHHHHR
jgi:predicted dehydrogenase